MGDTAKTPHPSRLANALLIIVGMPILGILMGGVYSLPALKLSKERDPGLSLLLSMGLGTTVFGLGYFSCVPLVYLAGVWGFSLVLLVIARQAYGSLGHSLERFGIVHAVTLLSTAVVCVAVKLRSRMH